ncbi:hypothetical protein JOY44_13140 [Phormidium sp. CLA17]|uniref:hypothetical protein n=1 Tax=Leptolyngbya sp. Cla-17 TaxID=2803751 RepID=UPI001490DEC5|nr:hypothetical protein [Leptolyngbya sp. Cla-17]MBM0742550.1 hypothetical protein [Leptolyngbya sp. Cla-17]
MKQARIPTTTVEQTVDKITSSGRITRLDQQQFMATLLSLDTLNSTEQALINRVFDLLRAGRLRVVD